MRKQTTIKNEVSLPEGTGLHTGRKVRVTFKPAAENSGIIFVRIDIAGKPQLPANIDHVIDPARRPRRTSIGVGAVELHTIEHVMAACCGCDVDNLIIEVNGEELPGYDGSSLPFYNALQDAGIIEQEAAKKIFQAKEPLWMEEDNTLLLILPSRELRVSYTLKYDHPFLKSQYVSLIINREIFGREIAPSRTFCLEDEIEKLRAEGLGQGANYDNTLVVNKNGIAGKNKLRFEDEFVRHKISDLLGDMYLLGCAIEGHIVAIKSGHALNIKLLQKIKTRIEKTPRISAAVVDSAEIKIDLPLDINAIQKILPHRYPFLLVDRIRELQEDKYAVGIKNVTVNEQFFNGHFPGHPVMPGVLIIEAMAQVAGVLMLSKKENLGSIAYFMSIDKVKFRRTVLPGDQLILEVKVIKIRSRVLQVEGRASVNGKVVAEADMLFSLRETKDKDENS